jgi:hypothetical protein
MNVKTCKFCKKTHQGFSSLCPSCVQQLDDKYVIVRNYLDKNPKGTLTRIADETGVDEKSLLFLMREGRISLKDGGSTIACLMCGKPIASGRYCNKCKDKLFLTLELTKSEMESLNKPVRPAQEMRPGDRGRMHMLGED